MRLAPPRGPAPDAFSEFEGVRLTIFLAFALPAPPDEPELAGFEDAVREYDDVIVDTRELQLN